MILGGFMNKLAKLINSLDSDDLKKIKKDLVEGNLLKLVDDKLKKLGDFNKVCPVCGTPTKEDHITISFGEPGLRKKASFCGEDCLEYFLRDMKKKNLKL